MLFIPSGTQSEPKNVGESTCETVSSPGSVRDGRTSILGIIMADVTRRHKIQIPLPLGETLLVQYPLSSSVVF